MMRDVARRGLIRFALVIPFVIVNVACVLRAAKGTPAEPFWLFLAIASPFAYRYLLLRYDL